MALCFACAIFVGTALLSLPNASSSGQPLSLVNALFLATSATCITGLSCVDIGTDLTRFGQIVILVLAQFGGLGITTFGTFLLVLMGRRLSVQNESLLTNSLGIEESHGIRTLLFWTIGITFLLEGIGALLLMPRYLHHAEYLNLPNHYGVLSYYALFHSVSAFCNAGFSLHKDSLAAFQRDPLFLGVIDLLILAGGLGFLVIHNLITTKFWSRNLMSRGRLSLHSKITLSAALLLIVFGTLAFLVQEWQHTLEGLSLPDKINVALFHSITPRSAGFNLVPMDAISEQTRFTTNLLMLIGGAPGSAAGGIKTTTLVVLILTIVAMCKGRNDTVVFGRTVSATVVREALAIVLLALLGILIAFGILLRTEAPLAPDESSKLLFETISAAATVGLSINHTGTLSPAGQFVIIVCMFLGRLGPLAIALFIGNRDARSRVRFPEEPIAIG